MEKKMKKLPKGLGIIGFVVAQVVGVVWWAAKVDNKVSHHERYVDEIPKIAEQIRTISCEINKIKEKLYGRKTYKQHVQSEIREGCK